MTKQADFKRRVRERMAKTGESYTAARAQLLAQADAATLHVTNGDSTALSLRQTALVERVVAWRDVLHEGPVPDVGDAELRAVRASFLGAPVGELEARDAALAAGREGEYVLWFEADLYDQLQIAQILARLAALRVPAERITLICIGEHLGIAHFGGLGELRPDQLEALPAAAAVDPHRRRARPRHPRVGGAARPRPARPGGHRGGPLARSCASCPRPSTASAASTRGRATASRSPSAGCSPRSPRAPARRARRSCAARRARRARSSATRGPSRRSSGWRGARCRCCRSTPAL